MYFSSIPSQGPIAYFASNTLSHTIKYWTCLLFHVFSHNKRKDLRKQPEIFKYHQCIEVERWGLEQETRFLHFRSKLNNLLGSILISSLKILYQVYKFISPLFFSALCKYLLADSDLLSIYEMVFSSSKP